MEKILEKSGNKFESGTWIRYVFCRRQLAFTEDELVRRGGRDAQ